MQALEWQDVILVTFGTKGYSTSNPHDNLLYFMANDA